MTTVSLAFGRPTLVDRLLRRSVATDLVFIAAGAALVSIAAQISVPIGPVPITGQTLAALIVGSSLGAVRGTLSMVLYAVIGALGLPVFSDGSHGVGVIFGATGGYIIGFTAAAALTGWLAQRSWDHRILGALASFGAGTVVTFAVGLPWLAVVGHYTLTETLQYGLYPFIFGGIIKAVIAAGFVRLAWFGVNRADSTESRRL
ncbi:biotin transporter BioY [Lacisediminihabitans changchengi]|uniref:Biotin transporter n=1 Tax=Lacisediminihabitans changchengi TaxID=2787634 RepID=A0A934SK95_9MICO|nr:biotin transporter BioY [Lacisediminihabitans changchengi]MBK4346870.1 biotin transporter BioY [Lacisediminihabitans changchengi]MBK4348007.1 biotin transporter BioY [Lacisediminihabitans changchengi]